MPISSIILAALISSACLQETRPIVAVYYYPGYHPQVRGKHTAAEHWSEWDDLKRARPRFDGDVQPKFPLWGDLDESKPDAMAKKIRVASTHGVDAFIFDWNWSNHAPYLGEAMDAFLKAPNHNDMKFAVMWTSASGSDSGATPEQSFDELCDYVIAHYFSQPNYLKVHGKPFFSIYQIWTLVAKLKGTDKARAALDHFREKARRVGFSGVFIDSTTWGLMSQEAQKWIPDPKAAAQQLGIDSATTYTWSHHIWPPTETMDYNQVRDLYFKFWDSLSLGVPYFPNVTMGWDPTPRHYNPMRIFTGNTPARFEEALRLVRDRLKGKPGPQMITINAWNEWTEGSFLEPELQYGMGYLDALKRVFGKSCPGRDSNPHGLAANGF